MNTYAIHLSRIVCALLFLLCTLCVIFVLHNTSNDDIENIDIPQAQLEVVMPAVQDIQNVEEETIQEIIEHTVETLICAEPEIISDIVTVNVRLYNEHQDTFNLVDGQNYIDTISTYLLQYAPEGMFISAACAQAYTEGGAGKAGVYRSTNNCFGITAGPSWSGYVFSRSTQLVYKDYATAVSYGATDLFRAYDSIEESVIDYISLIQTNRYKDALTTETPREYLAHLLSNGYGEKESLEVWLSLIEMFNLTLFDELNK